MDGFIASLGNEEIIVRRDGAELKKLHRKLITKRDSNRNIREETVVETQIIYIGKGDLRALAAFHTEKDKVRKEGFSIRNFNSSTEPLPEKKPRQNFLQRKRKFLGRFVNE